MENIEPKGKAAPLGTIVTGLQLFILMTSFFFLLIVGKSFNLEESESRLFMMVIYGIVLFPEIYFIIVKKLFPYLKTKFISRIIPYLIWSYTIYGTYVGYTRLSGLGQ